MDEAYVSFDKEFFMKIENVHMSPIVCADGTLPLQLGEELPNCRESFRMVRTPGANFAGTVCWQR